MLEPNAEVGERRGGGDTLATLRGDAQQAKASQRQQKAYIITYETLLMK